MGAESFQDSERDSRGMRVSRQPQRRSVSHRYTPSDIQRSPKPTRAQVLRCTGPSSAAPRCQLPPATANCDSCFVTLLPIPFALRYPVGLRLEGQFCRSQNSRLFKKLAQKKPGSKAVCKPCSLRSLSFRDLVWRGAGSREGRSRWSNSGNTHANKHAHNKKSTSVCMIQFHAHSDAERVL
jgi:hypothetical protein